MKFSYLSLICMALIATVLSIPDVTKHEVDYRITSMILPSSYNITLQPYLRNEDAKKQFTFDGEVFIVISTTESNLSTVILHSKNLSYSFHEYYESATPDKKTEIKTVSFDEVTDKLTLMLDSALKPKTSYTLHFVYTGIMEDDMEGFYKSYYVDDRNNTRWLGSTQFETNHARRAFPCFDEPKFKATFDVTIIRHKSFNTVSNTRILCSERFGKNYYKDVFETTPPMSTYILAFLVSEFKGRNDGDFFIVARPEYYQQTEYAFNVGRKLLIELDKYTGLPYYENGIDKMHLAAIPDFSAGAMENWGLLMFREFFLLYDEGSTTLLSKQKIVATISHEQAHMWFGDLVTCDWWSYTWLHEGFASYFQFFMSAVVHPEMEWEKQFVVDQIHKVFTDDSTNITHPLNDENVTSSEDQTRMFDDISYKKGSSFVRMINHIIGEDSFKKSLRSYLSEFKYKNTVPKNIFDHWKNNWPAESKQHADGVLKSFTEQVGYPVIHVEVAADSKSMTLEQKRFLLNPGDGSDASLLYTVPFTFTTSLQKNFTTTKPNLYLEANTDKTRVNFDAPIEWVIGNIQETGYYRVNYSTPVWHKIHHALRSNNWGGIHDINRAQYVDDLLAFSRAGELSYDLSLMCLNYLDTETDYLPWTAAFNGFDYLAIRLGLDKQNFGNFIIQMSRKAYDTLGFEERKQEMPLQIYTRSKVLSWNCKYGHKDCITQSLKLFRNMTNAAVPVNIRGAVYCTAMRDGTEADFENLYNKLKNEKVPTEQILIINNLGCVHSQKLVERYFNIILSDEIRRQDKSSALRTLYSENAENVSPVFDLVTANFEALEKSLGSYSSVAKVISNIASRFTTEEQEKRLGSFISANGSKFGSSEKKLKKAADTVKENVAWSEKRLGSVSSFLNGFKNSARRINISLFTISLMALVAFILQ